MKEKRDEGHPQAETKELLTPDRKHEFRLALW